MNPQNQPPQIDPTGQNNNEQGTDPQVVYMSRPMEPHRQQISDEMRQKHEESKRLFPRLNLSEGEYVISAIKRHPIGLVLIWTVTGLVILALVAASALLVGFTKNSQLSNGQTISPEVIAIPVILLSILALLFGFVSSIIYNANRFYLTNESVIQHIQVSLFNQREQTISLANIEDASFSQDGIVAHIFDYGLIRLSTQGDETTYRFTYASNPNQQIALLNNAVEDFKNVRPIED